MTDVSKLVPFTGYYAMHVAPGAFLSIDTTEVQSPEATNIVINVSMDGKSLHGSYPFSAGGAFDGAKLHIPGKLTLHFSRQYSNGRLATFSGAVGSTHVSGETYFNPVPLSAFVGDYYDATTNKKALSLKSDTEILFDFSVLSKNPSGQLQAVISYSYVPAMFVLTFTGGSSDGPGKFMLMLGTGAAFGLACSIQDADSPPKFAPKIVLSIL
ncbi:MAG TPA: hypothetical protein VH206_21025 [Xanthobacteraceae bacterium]|jgi:hypothetical protein|nr:hypothetical protein [Xanthobacteraceae bacterium]